MINKIKIIIISLIMIFSLSSCDTMIYTTTQDDVYVETQVDIVQSNVGFDTVIRYGTPYYRNGVVLYYFYDNIYYYPYYYNNYWYVRAYRRPFTHFSYRPYFRPHRYDYRFSPGYYKGFERQQYRYYHTQPRRSIQSNSNYYNRNRGIINQDQKINGFGNKNGRNIRRR